MKEKRRILKKYQVFHSNMRDAQIYTQNIDDIEIDDEGWSDIHTDLLFGYMMAESQEEAVKRFAELEDCHESNLYADEVKVSAQKTVYREGRETLELVGTSFETDDEFGIEITLPDKRTAKIVIDCKDMKPIFVIYDDNTKEEQTKIYL